MNEDAAGEPPAHFEQIDIEAQISALIAKRHDPLDFSSELSRTTQNMRAAYEQRLRTITQSRDRIAEQIQLQEQLRQESEAMAEGMVRAHRDIVRHQQRLFDAHQRLRESEEWLARSTGPVEEMIAGFDQQVARINAAIAVKKLATKPLGRFDVRYNKQRGGADKPKAEPPEKTGHQKQSNSSRQPQQQKATGHSDAQWYDWISWLHREMIPEDPMAE